MLYYLYQHLDSNSIPFYIGKGTVNTNSHSYKGYTRAYSKSKRNKNWQDVAKNGFSVKIIETSADEDYILKKEESLFKECKTCVNKQTNKVFDNYTITKISDSLAEFKVLDRIWYISSSGKYYNDQMKELVLGDNGKGYLTCKIHKKPIKVNIYIHKLVAQAFIPNPLNFKTINHIDRNKYNNDVSNLEWCTQQSNNIHKIQNGGYTSKPTKKVLQYDLNNNFIKEWKGVPDIYKHYNCSKSLIYWGIKTGKSCLNFLWKYEI